MPLTGHRGSSHDGDEKPVGPRRRHASRFTYKNLADLAAASPTSPLRVLAHIDLDAYYAQCEMLRLGTDDDTPLVVQQWRNIIAVNYPARKFGITRMISAEKAKGMCPSLVVQHVPSWKEGEGQWAYHADSFSAMAHHKVSLEPYRIRSREILATLKESLPSTPTMAVPCKIEKAGIDEVFVDLSPYIHDLLVHKLYPDLFARYREHSQDEPATELPLPPVSEADLDWDATGSGVIDHVDKRVDEAQAQDQEQDIDKGILGDGVNTPLSSLVASQENGDDEDPVDDTVVDWDDIAMLEGARIVQAMRQALFDKLRFRCSAGVASNKMLSKLGSSQHKPNKQTVVRPRAVSKFLASLSSVTKLRGLGGKMGLRVVTAFDTESIAELLTVPLPQMQAKLNDQEAGYNIYWMIRGIDASEVTARTEIKSIISAKSFQPPLTTMEQAMRWIRVYVAELKCRLLDEKLSLALLAAATVVAPPPTVVDPAAASVATASGINPSENPSDNPSDNPNDNPTGNQDMPNAPNGGGTLELKQGQATALAPAPVPLPMPMPSPATSAKQNQLRLPQTIRLHYGHGTVPGQGWRSRQMRIPRDGTPLDEDKLLRLGKQLLEQAQRADALWPCTHLAISVDGFEEPVKGNKSIESFFQPKASSSSTLLPPSTLNKPPEELVDGENGDYDSNYNALDAGENSGVDAPHAGEMNTNHGIDDKNDRPLFKRRRLGAEMEMTGPNDGEERRTTETKSGEVGSSSRLFDERPTATSNSSSIIDILKNTRPHSMGGIGEIKSRADSLPSVSSPPVSSLASFFGNHGSSAGFANHGGGSNQRLSPGIAIGDSGLQAEAKEGRASEQCSQCGQFFGSAVDLQEHQDWHVARVLQAKERVVLTPSTSGSSSSALPSRRRGVAAHSKRAGAPPSISSFFQNHNPTRTQSQSQSQSQTQTPSWSQSQNRARSPDVEASAEHISRLKDNAIPGGTGDDTAADSLSCHRCGAVFGHADEAQVHQDWHFAKDLASSLG